MYSSINDEMRNKIINKNSFDLTLLNIEQLDLDSREYFFRLILSDYYKINYYRSLINKDMEFLDFFNDSLDDLLDMCDRDEKFLADVINCSKKFNSLKPIQKIMLLDLLSKRNQDKTLINISNSHLLDKITYTFSYDLNSFTEYYNSFNDKSVVNFITNKLVEYKKDNYKEYKKLVTEFIKTYYKWTIFVKHHFDSSHLYNEDYIYLEIIRFNSLEDIIKYTEYDLDFLKTIIKNYLIYSTEEKYISEEIIDKFYNKNIDEDLKKKLK